MTTPNRYLEKLAQVEKSAGLKDKIFSFVTKDHGVMGNAAKASTIGNIAAMGPALLAGKALNKVIDKPIAEASRAASWKDLKSFMRENNLQKEVTFRTHTPGGVSLEDMMPQGSGPAFLSKNSLKDALHANPLMRLQTKMDSSVGRITGVRGQMQEKGLDAALHELGHAKDFAHDKYGIKAKVNSLVRDPRVQQGANLAGKILSNNPKTRALAPVVAGLPAAGILREELAANYHAAKHLYKQHGKDAAIQYLKNTAPGLGTYVAGHGHPIASAIIQNKILNKIGS